LQVNVVNGGRDAFNALLYPTHDPGTMSWLNNNVNRAREVLTGVADNLVAASVNLYNRVNSDAVVNAAKALVGSQGGAINQYAIYGLDYNSMCSANYIMQQYIMANPMVQTMVDDNLCNGFEETYYDSEPGTRGVDRLDYQRVMDGVVQEGDDDLYIMHYSSTDEVELSIHDQHLIIDSWEQAENMILNMSLDPTDPDGNEL